MRTICVVSFILDYVDMENKCIWWICWVGNRTAIELFFKCDCLCFFFHLIQSKQLTVLPYINKIEKQKICSRYLVSGKMMTTAKKKEKPKWLKSHWCSCVFLFVITAPLVLYLFIYCVYVCIFVDILCIIMRQKKKTKHLIYHQSANFCLFTQYIPI